MGDEVKTHFGTCVIWCSHLGRWAWNHSQSGCQATEHTMICIDPDAVCDLLNAMSDAFTGLRDGDPFVMDNLAKAFEDVTSESIEDH